jgi:hypothetical protein
MLKEQTKDEKNKIIKTTKEAENAIKPVISLIDFNIFLIPRSL